MFHPNVASSTDWWRNMSVHSILWKREWIAWGGKTAQLFNILRMKKEIHQKLYWSGEKQTRNTFWKIFVMSLSGEEIEFYENYILLKNLFIWNNWPYGYCWWGKHYQIPEYVFFFILNRNLQNKKPRKVLFR